MAPAIPSQVDLLVVGGGINGVGIARDAAGRGLSVLLVEKDDLGAHTSSSSSKLIHGGLRYLEHYEFRLVAESLAEREVLLKAAPHIVRPMRFVMPHVPQLRPAWMIRAGLFLYDYLARRDTLPDSEAVDLRASAFGAGLKPEYARGFAYSDCWVDDARLVVLTARAATEVGAVVLPHTACITAKRADGAWEATLKSAKGVETKVTARAIANVTGPWARQFLGGALRQQATFALKLVKGSHIVVPRLFEGDHAYILQNDDRRVIFVYAYEQHYSIVGTTEVDLGGEPGPCQASAEEVRYLCRAANRYFLRQLTEQDVAWSYAGIRPLFDDGAADPSAITRDYVLRLDEDQGSAPVLSVFGGKITTHRRLAEHALGKLAPWFPQMRPAWTATATLPGGDLYGGSFEQFAEMRFQRDFPWLPAPARRSLARRHGALAYEVLGAAASIADLGEHFGAELYAREVDYLVAREWARSAEDVLWRRTKAGLRLTPAQREAVARYLARNLAHLVAPNS